MCGGAKGMVPGVALRYFTVQTSEFASLALTRFLTTEGTLVYGNCPFLLLGKKEPPPQALQLCSLRRWLVFLAPHSAGPPSLLLMAWV